ncbi:hypothetical protein FXO37_14904 [Capsicum annuum]|nr:hypothetical protein FXO37_14904 [Capsicum annuum]
MRKCFQMKNQRKFLMGINKHECLDEFLFQDSKVDEGLTQMRIPRKLLWVDNNLLARGETSNPMDRMKKLPTKETPTKSTLNDLSSCHSYLFTCKDSHVCVGHVFCVNMVCCERKPIGNLVNGNTLGESHDAACSQHLYALYDEFFSLNMKDSWLYVKWVFPWHVNIDANPCANPCASRIYWLFARLLCFQDLDLRKNLFQEREDDIIQNAPGPFNGMIMKREVCDDPLLLSKGCHELVIVSKKGRGALERSKGSKEELGDTLEAPAKSPAAAGGEMRPQTAFWPFPKAPAKSLAWADG